MLKTANCGQKRTKFKSTTIYSNLIERHLTQSALTTFVPLSMVERYLPRD